MYYILGSRFFWWKLERRANSMVIRKWERHAYIRMYGLVVLLQTFSKGGSEFLRVGKSPFAPKGNTVLNLRRHWDLWTNVCLCVHVHTYVQIKHLDFIHTVCMYVFTHTYVHIRIFEPEIDLCTYIRTDIRKCVDTYVRTCIISKIWRYTPKTL